PLDKKALFKDLAQRFEHALREEGFEKKKETPGLPPLTEFLAWLRSNSKEGPEALPFGEDIMRVIDDAMQKWEIANPDVPKSQKDYANQYAIDNLFQILMEAYVHLGGD